MSGDMTHVDYAALKRRLQEIERIKCPDCREMARRKLKEETSRP